MKKLARLCGIVILLLTAMPLTAAAGAERSLIFLFGPGFAGMARQGASAAAATAHRWLETPGSRVEIRRAGNAEPLLIDAQRTTKDLLRAFSEAAAQARDADPAAFVDALNAAAQAAALRPGVAILVAILNSPPLSSGAETAIGDIVELCRNHRVRVIVLDIGERGAGDSKSALETLATRTGGMALRHAKALDVSVDMVLPRSGVIENRPAAEKTAASEKATAVTVAPGNSPIPFEIPVHARFIRTSTTGSVSAGTVAQLGGTDAKGSNSTMAERPYEANDSTDPLRGLLMVESPLSALKFDSDDGAGTYQAKARVTATIRNRKGTAVWVAQKEINIHGPLRKLPARRSGSLLFMRGLTLLGGEQYTLEAKVEDLLGSTAGNVSLPVRTGAGAPGLMASDALCVRPFKSAADRFEADQVFSYEGEALSPVLNPEFRTEEQIDLQLYLVLYPDVYGPPPEMNLELLQNGKVVTRMPLQFKNAMSDPSREGKFGTLGGKGAVMFGGKAREFPYLANIKGAKLSPGNYDATVFIRQGRNVITRNVSFRVAGSAGAADGGAATGAGSGAAGIDTAPVVLPEIAPATVDSSGLAVGLDEQKRLWEEAGAVAMGYSAHLPNFRCTQETHRFVAPAKTPEQLKEADSLKHELTYEDGKETYRTIAINGALTDKLRSELKGVHSRGEFGSMLQGLFDPEVGAAYKWMGRSVAMGVLCEVFEVQVSKAKSNFSLTHNGRRETAAYSGRVFIDEETGQVRRLTIEGAELPKDFPLQSPSFSLEYAPVRIGPDDYLLPLRSVLQLRQGRMYVRNESVFRDYRRFEGSSEIKYSDK